MREFDVIVIGSGAGMNVGSNAYENNMEIALVEHGVMGGTCLNNGCIPTKIMLGPADVVRKLDEAGDIGIEGKITKVDFSLIMKRTRSFVDEGRIPMERGISAAKGITWFKDTGEFIDDYTMKVGKDTIRAPRIIIASGSRPFIPPIEGLMDVGFLTNINVLDLKRPPKSLIIVGGGYIACEFGHFFSAMGTKVVILGRNPRLLKREEPEISEIVKRRFSKFVRIHTNYEVIGAEGKPGKKVLIAQDRATKKRYRFKSEEIMLAAGRISNADLLKFHKTGVETDEHGWVKVDEHLQTTKENIWACGDALGVHLFRHTANHEADVVWKNAFLEKKVKVDYHAVPHAVFGHPQVGAVGLTEKEAKAAGYKILVGSASYMDVTKGYAMGEKDSLVKVVVDQNTRKILGCSIVGSEAAELVQQVTYLMNAGKETYLPLVRAQIIHPALSEVVINAFGNMTPVNGQGHEHRHGHGNEPGLEHSHDNGNPHDHHS